MEKEQDYKLSFLDVIITRTEQGFKSSVYQEPPFTREYLNFNYHHPYNTTKGIVRCLQHRAKAITNDANAYQEGMKSLRDNCPESITLAPRNLDRTTENNTRKLTTVCLPYVKGYVVHMISGQNSGVV